MCTRRHIDVNHYALDNQGRVVHVTPYPNALEGTNPNKNKAGQTVIKDMDASQPLLLLPPFMTMMVNCTSCFGYMPTNNVVHVVDLKTYISTKYLGTTEVETATAALNVADPSTGDEGGNGNFPYVYFYRIFSWNISHCCKVHVFDIYKFIL